MMQQRAKRLLLIILLSIGGTVLVRGQERDDPVYVGSRVCASCHDGPGMGHQYSRWLLSKHARAYAVLAKPEAKKIAKLSGIPQEPQDSPMCLGCHATGAEAEAWERDETFHMEDGVQCEKCHGPGSEYMGADIMRDRQKAMMAGLKMPTRRRCLVCHIEKGSHIAIHKLPQLNIEEAWESLAHPTPENPEWEPLDSGLATRAPSTDGANYIGAVACGACHRGPEMGYQYSRWRMSRHASAFATLSSQRAYEIARNSGVYGEPQRSHECLKCHATGGGSSRDESGPGFSHDEGVGCEACHGPGSEYQFEAVMTDHVAAREAGLKQPGKETCLRCHDNAHGKAFDYQAGLNDILHPSEPVKESEEICYKTPVNLALSSDGKELYIACEASDSVIVVDTVSRTKVAEIPVGRQPNDVSFSPDGSHAYVSNRLDDTVSVIDVSARKLDRTFPVGDEPHGILTNAEGKSLYVLNTSEDTISIINAETGQEMRRLSASRNPWSLAASPDGSKILVTNTLSRFVPFRTPAMSEVTVVDVAREVVVDRWVVPATNLLQGVDWHPSGEFALVTMTRTKNLVPMTRLLQGWTITNGLGIVWRDGHVDQVLLDEPDMAFPDPADVAFTPDGKLALVTSSGSDRVAVIDVGKLQAILKAASPYERKEILPNHLGRPTEFIIGHIPTEKSPRGITVASDSKTAYVVNALDDSLSVLDLSSLALKGRIDLGGPEQITKARFGEQVFHNARITFHRQFSCHTCHPDGHVDGITYDIEPDGVGVSPVDNRTLRGILDTAPFKWEGTNPSLQRQCGPRLAVFFTRIAPFTPEELSAIDLYISTITRPPNRFRPLGAELTDAQRRGKKMFERMTTNDGRDIPVEKRCVTCHPAPLHTDRRRHDVGTRMLYDRESRFDVPHLNNIYDSAPYLHNGMAPTLEEIWTRYNPDDMHGVTNDMTKDQLNDLIEYLKTL